MAAYAPVPRHTIPRNTNPGASPPPGRWRRQGGSRPNSRFSTPIRASRTPYEPSDMAVDETQQMFDRIAKSGAIFAKSNEMQVSFYAHLPEEVTKILRNANFYDEAYTGDVDTVTGFALVASAETCFVWKYSQALAGTPTCYIFGCPQEQTTFLMTTPFHALVPYGSTREPGLILMTSGGQIRFWQSLASGLAGGEHWIPASLDLQELEQVTTLTRADPQTYVVSTSIGRLFRLTLTSSGGRYHLSPKCFARPQSSLSFSRLLPTFFAAANTGQMPYESGNINAIALREHSGAIPSGRDVWALIDYRIQRWTMSAEGWEELELDEDIAALVRPALRGKLDNTPKSDAELDLELLDLKLLSANQLLLLVSYAGQEEESAAIEISQAPRRIYALLQISSTNGSFKVDSIKSVPYQSSSSSGAPMHPRMQLLLDGQLVTIQFGDTVTICARENEYMDRLELKSSSDRTLGVGILENESSFLVLTAATLMKTYVDPDAVGEFDAERGKANLIQSTMTQAILYGSHKDNPLHFSFPPEVDEEALMRGAEQLSQAILESDSKVVRPNLDLSAQITHRRERLQFLIQFINDNGVLTKMSQRCRQRLQRDAENLQAAYDLWLIFNESLSSGDSRNVLSEAIYRYMNDVKEGHHEDYMRAFFRLRAGDIGSILPRVRTVLRESTHDPTRSFVDTVPQANRILLTVLDAAMNCRQDNYGLYGISRPLINPWTSHPAVIDIANELFTSTARLIEQPSSEADQPLGRVQAKEQLPQLASVLFGAYYERLEYLSGPFAADQREKSTLEDRFRHSRPEVLETLRRNGFANHAFHLAEEYRDFRSLASLCNKETIYPPQDNPNASRISAYIEKFKEDFAHELYQWYIEHGELRTMFAQAQEQDEYLDSFFAEHPHPNISWIHQLGKGSYGQASETLLEQADSAPELSSKQLMLSIGKLSYLAQIHDEVPPALNESVVNAFHDGLDFISVHETLIEHLKAALVDVHTRQSLEQQVATIVQKQAQSLASRRAFYSVFKQLVRRLLQGKALSLEDVADVLSMKDNTDRLEDYVTAFHLLSTAKHLPQARRQSALRTVWRRIYLHDDWNQIRQTANVPDAEINNRLRRTALYAALYAATQGLSSVILDPAQTEVIPSIEDIQSRWQGTPAEEIAEIWRDYESDANDVKALELVDVFARVNELVGEDLAKQS